MNKLSEENISSNSTESTTTQAELSSLTIGETTLSLYAKGNTLIVIGVRNGKELIKVEVYKYNELPDSAYCLMDIMSGSADGKDYISVAIMEEDEERFKEEMTYAYELFYTVSDSEAEWMGDGAEWDNSEVGSVWEFNRESKKFNRVYYGYVGN